MLGPFEIEASRDHHTAFEPRVVSRIVERRARAHRMAHHHDSRSVDEVRLAEELDRVLHILAQPVAALAFNERISILAMPAHIDREDAISVLRDTPGERTRIDAIG